MLRRENKPAITGAFNVTAPTSEEWGGVEVARLGRSVQLGFDAANQTHPPPISHDERSPDCRGSQPDPPAIPLAATLELKRGAGSGQFRSLTS